MYDIIQESQLVNEITVRPVRFFDLTHHRSKMILLYNF